MAGQFVHLCAKNGLSSAFSGQENPINLPIFRGVVKVSSGCLAGVSEGFPELAQKPMTA